MHNEIVNQKWGKYDSHIGGNVLVFFHLCWNRLYRIDIHGYRGVFGIAGSIIHCRWWWSDYVGMGHVKGFNGTPCPIQMDGMKNGGEIPPFF